MEEGLAKLRRHCSILQNAGAVVVLSPGSTGVLPNDHPQNMHVGGSKGTISGNYAMQEAELVIFVGSRGVCQSDCSGMGWPKAKYVINVNTDFNDALTLQQYSSIARRCSHSSEATDSMLRQTERYK